MHCGPQFCETLPSHLLRESHSTCLPHGYPKPERHPRNVWKWEVLKPERVSPELRQAKQKEEFEEYDDNSLKTASLS